jgi:hypothetical protein
MLACNQGLVQEEGQPPPHPTAAACVYALTSESASSCQHASQVARQMVVTATPPQHRRLAHSNDGRSIGRLQSHKNLFLSRARQSLSFARRCPAVTRPHGYFHVACIRPKYVAIFRRAAHSSICLLQRKRPLSAVFLRLPPWAKLRLPPRLPRRTRRPGLSTRCSTWSSRSWRPRTSRPATTSA